MALSLVPHSGDGQSGDGLSVGLAPPIPPGQLIITDILAAEDLDRGPTLPLVLSHVPAGFPSPADDYVEDHLDLMELVGATNPSCFFMRCAGESMTGDGIFHGDILVVDRAVIPVHGAIVVASVDGELTVKKFARRGERVMLLATNPAYPCIELQGEQELIVWGTVTWTLRDQQPRSSRR
ncbi:MAG: translesion error-prone DNA polymerase V autoproteolytic subunit [Bacteroidota bacterium]